MITNRYMSRLNLNMLVAKKVRKMKKKYKKLKRLYIGLAVIGAISYPPNTKSHKSIKNWREAMKYLPRIDRAGVLRRMGSVLTLDKVALRREMEKEYIWQRQRKVTIVECSNSGFAHSSRSSRGGNYLERRENERRKQEILRDQRTLSQVLVRLLNPTMDGSDPRILETTGKLQILEQIAISSTEDGRPNPAKDSPIYVGITPHPSNRLESSEEKSGKNEQEEVLKNDSGIKQDEKESMEKERKNSLGRRIEDGLLLVVSTKIYGHTIKAVIDSGATRCFVTPTCVTTCGFKAKPRDVFLELGNGEKFLSRGSILDVPVVIVDLTVKIGLTVTNFLHKVDLVLGMT